MSPGAVQFAKDFARLKSESAAQSVADSQLLRLIAFWPQMQSVAAKESYRTYLDEYCLVFLRLINEQVLFDLTIDELTEARAIHGRLKEHLTTDQTNERLEQSGRLLTYRLITMHCYLGDFKKAWELVRGDPIDPDILGELQDLDAFDALDLFIDRLHDKHPDIAEILTEVRDRWGAERSCVNNDRAWCLFVEQNQSTSDNRGRLRQLRGTVESSKRKSGTDNIADTVTFDNQIKTPDDKFIGVVYHSLAAVKELRARTRAGNHHAQYDARFSIADSKQTFTGDSIGLAAALITYTQLLKLEIMRQERFIAGEVGFTGGIDEQGTLLPVNQDTLPAKIHRAFFSPLKYLVLAEECLPDAGIYLEPLAQQYPCRNLILIGHRRFADVIENHNIVRSEKVCLGAFLTRKAVKYSRAAKIQIPLLAALLWVFLAILFPKIFDPWFDHNPAYVQVSNTGFTVANADSVSLWDIDYGCSNLRPETQWRIGDLDGDGKNEIAILPRFEDICTDNVRLFVYDHQGRLKVSQSSTIYGKYPGDSTDEQIYSPGVVNFTDVNGSTYIVTTATASYPSRTHIRILNSEGAEVGWYINAGGASAKENVWLASDVFGFVFAGVNNKEGATCLFALTPDSSYGVSPPYQSENYDLSWVTKGNQKYYILFPSTDVCKSLQRLYNTPWMIRLESDSVLCIETFESMGKDQAEVIYRLGANLRVMDVKLTDNFCQVRNFLVADGKLEPVEWQQYTDTLRDSVKYWINGAWISEAMLRESS